MRTSPLFTFAALVLVACLSCTSDGFTAPQRRTALQKGGRIHQVSPSGRCARLSSTAEPVSQTAESDQEGKPGNGYILPAFDKTRSQVIASLRDKLEDKSMEDGLVHYVNEYFRCCSDSKLCGNEVITPWIATKNILNSIKRGMINGTGDNKYVFEVAHRSMQGRPESEGGNTFDYHNFGVDFFRPLIDLPNSVLLGEENAKKAFEQVRKGDNVVFFANHQVEPDPQVFCILLELIGLGKEAEHVFYVAGHKVTTDVLAIPFSMGKNLLCIHSKKHLLSDPSTKALKQKQNMSAMNEMLAMLKEGGAMLWVAPSGGRDRRDVVTGDIPIAPFDHKTIDMFRLIANKSGRNTHFYPLAMRTYDLCPPPDFVEAGVGERRYFAFAPVGIAFGDELTSEGGMERRTEFNDKAEAECRKGYEGILKAIEEKTQSATLKP